MSRGALSRKVLSIIETLAANTSEDTAQLGLPTDSK